MRMLEVRQPGPAMTVQDLGRHGYQRFGVAEGGAVDRGAHILGAVLLDQAPDTASIEMAAAGGVFAAGSDPLAAVVTGAGMPTRVEGRAMPHATVFRVPPGATVEIGPPASGVYGYLSVGGGIDVPPVLGSRSTHTRASFGGLNGRTLEAGDLLPIGAHRGAPSGRRAPDQGFPTGPIRFLWGLHAELLGETARSLLVTDEFVMSSRRDRMGARLDPPTPLPTPNALNLPSSPVVNGDIQVPGDGHPVVLLADRQPTGGYPRIGTVITADLGRFVQTMVGTPITFEPIEPQQAVALLLAFEAALASLAETITAPAQASMDLSTPNLISGFTVGDEEDE